MLPLSGELDDEDGVFARQPHEHNKADLREDCQLQPPELHADRRAEQTHGDDQDNRQGQFPALILRREHQKYEYHGQREYVHCRVAGLVLQVRQFRPLVSH